MTLDSTEAHLAAALASAQARGRVPSVVAAVVRDGRAEWFGARGRTVRRADGERGTPGTQYRIGSITKTFTAALVLQLREEGRLKLDDTVAEHAPDAPFGDATLRGLLSHAAGLPAEPVGPWWERSRGVDFATLARAHAAAPRVLPVGEQYHYSNLAYSVLGRVVETLRAQPWGDALRSQLLEPLGMSQTSYGPLGAHAEGFSVDDLTGTLTPEPLQDTGAMAPAGQLWSTTDDLCRWMNELSRSDPQVLSSASVRAMATPQSADPDERLTGAYGLGLRLAGPGPRILVGHSGSMPGFLAGMFVDRSTTVGAVVLSNAAYGLEVEALVRRLVETVVTHEPPLEAEWVPSGPFEEGARELLGPWYWGNAPFKMALDGGLLRLWAADRSMTFEPAGTDRWRGRSGYQTGETLQVVRRADGSVSHLDLGTFCYTRTPYDPTVAVPGAGDEPV